MASLRDDVKNAELHIQETLTSYAADRKPTTFVGQFVDNEGRLDGSQFGIYGMSAWAYLTRTATNDKVKGLRSGCLAKLRAWVSEAKDGDLKELRRDPKSSPYELRFLAPKAAAVLEGFSRDTGSRQEAAWLRDHLLEVRRPDALWGMRLGPCEEKSLVATAQILRGLRVGDSTDDLTVSVTQLRAEVLNEPNACVRLYLQSTIVLMTADAEQRKKARKDMWPTIREVVRTAGEQPFAFANPYNFHFHDSARVRYFCLPTDIVLLEALVLVSGKNLIYVSAHVGRRLFDRLTEALKPVPIQVDTIRQRPAFSTLAYYQQVLSLMNERLNSDGTVLWPLVNRAVAWVSCNWALGMALRWHVIAFLLSAVIALVSLHNKWDVVNGIATGAMVKSIIDIVGNLPLVRSLVLSRYPNSRQ